MATYGNSMWDDLKFQVRSGNVIIRIIIVNVLVFIAINLVGVAAFFTSSNGNLYIDAVMSWLWLPMDPITILKRPWTIVTHMFVHVPQSIFHILFNMYLFYWIGGILVQFVGERKVLPIYFMGGLAGAFLAVLFTNTVPVMMGVEGAYGASAAVSAIMVAAATLTPTYTIRLFLIGVVQLRYFVLAVVVLDVIFMYQGNAGGTIAHIGGAVFGYLFVRQLQVGSDWSSGFYFVWDGVGNIINKVTNAFTPNQTKGPKMVYKNPNLTNNFKESPAEDEKQAKIDAILDKITSSGYESLSKEEKSFLDRNG